MIEHNPLNPVTRVLVRRTPVDSDAVLLPGGEARQLTRRAGFTHLQQDYFLYFPQSVYRNVGRLENVLAIVPLGGQYAVFSAKPS